MLSAWGRKRCDRLAASGPGKGRYHQFQGIEESGEGITSHILFFSVIPRYFVFSFPFSAYYFIPSFFWFGYFARLFGVSVLCQPDSTRLDSL